MAYNPNEPRDAGGQWTTSFDGTAALLAAASDKNITSNHDTLGQLEDKIRNNSFESAGLYNNGKQILFKNGSSKEIGFTQQEVDMMKGGVLTHNHPNGKSFSLADLQLFHETKLNQLRIVSKDVEFSLSGNILNKSRSEIEAIYENNYSELKQQFDEQIYKGYITKKLANKLIHHEHMNSVAKDLGLNYERKVLNKNFLHE